MNRHLGVGGRSSSWRFGSLFSFILSIALLFGVSGAWAAGWTDANDLTYTELKSINGGGSGLIVTDFKPEGTEIVEFKYKPSKVTGNDCIFCSRYYLKSGGNPQAQFGCFRISNKFRFDRGNYISGSTGHTTCETTTLKLGEDYSVVANFGGENAGKITINDMLQTQTITTAADLPAPGSVLVLLASHNNGQDITPQTFDHKATGDLYYFQLWNADGKTLKHDFRPARRDSDGAIGLYDTVEKKFWSATVGSFSGVEFSSVATATWTGKAGNGDFSDSGNWECYDADGNSLAEAVPGSETRITLGEDVPDTGLSEIPASYVGTIDLAGHRLVICGASEFAFSVTDSSTGDPGELCIVVPEGVAFNKTAAFGITGNLSLVKDGAGTLLWNGGTLAAGIPVVVADGVFKLGVTTANVFGNGGKITVMAGAQFDINTTLSDGQLRSRTFYIEGEGPDGSGALVNSAKSTTAGRQINKIVLTGDATIGGSGYIDIRDNGNGVDCGGNKLTVKSAGRFCVLDGHLTNATDIVVSGGNLWVCNACVLEAERIVLENGGAFKNYMGYGTSGTKYYNVPFIVREGSGTIMSEENWYTIDAPITVESGCTLNCPEDGPWYQGAITNKTDAILNVSGEFNALGRIFKNDGLLNHTAGKFVFGHRDNANYPCAVENNGTIKTSGGTFLFNAESSMTGAGTLELAGGSPQVLGDLSGFTGTIILSGGTATVSSSFGSFAGTLVLKDGAFAEAASLAGFKGTVVADLSGRKDALDVDGKNWFRCKEILVDLGERELEYGDKILSWTEKPAEVRFRLLGDRKASLRKTDDGLTYAEAPGFKVIVR